MNVIINECDEPYINQDKYGVNIKAWYELNIHYIYDNNTIVFFFKYIK